MGINIPVSILLSHLNLVEMNLPPYPEGLESVYETCIAHQVNPGNVCSYSVSEIKKIGQEPFSILLKKQISRVGNSVIWRVLDQMQWPKVNEEDYLSFGPCKISGSIDRSIIAVVKATETEWMKSTGWALKVDFEKGKFVPVNHENIACLNEGWDI